MKEPQHLRVIFGERRHREAGAKFYGVYRMCFVIKVLIKNHYGDPCHRTTARDYHPETIWGNSPKKH